ncbi:hypothetical protein GGP96_002620 [Salinibacter ruber]|uniref:Uncharacterized protein n=1 Tax=Salinibacter ruber TaxID=146919 RepID=A0A9X2U436_9BACT|nr:hypothetical protein [Salinibacter ruber]MCS3866476.1 hypothetical protein [Salinibacter ruber]MCS4151776.1 hypothetical protein [Salinibacter ruber]MCS4177880.1 hypothetical protein [Salinibacter ruber]
MPTGRKMPTERHALQEKRRLRAARDRGLGPPGTGRAGEKEESGSSARARPTGTQPARRQRDWDAFAFQHEKLKHLTTVGLVLSGGIITLFQSEMMEPSPQP